MAEPPPAAAYRHTNSPRISVCDGVIFDPMYTGTVLKTLIILLLFGTVAAAQEKSLVDNFPTAFEKAIRPGFTDKQFENFFSEYDVVLTADDQVAEAGSKPTPAMFPLYRFKNTKLYLGNIDKLLTSPNRYHRLLAVKLIGASDDTTREAALLKILGSGDEATIVIWAGMSLMQMKSVHTSELFDFLVKYEDFGDPHMVPFYFGLDPNLLQQTAYQRIAGPTDKDKILAAKSLSVTRLSPETDRALKKAVNEWNLELKGYAIGSIAKLRIGNLLTLLKPLLDDPKLRGVSLFALANSPTLADREFVDSLVNDSQSVGLDLMEALFRSENADNLRVWLKALYTKSIPTDYLIRENEQPLLISDEILPDLQTALEKITDPKILAHLVETLRGRSDDRSIDIILRLLNHPDSTVRYFTASVTRDNPSRRLKDPMIQQEIKMILRN